MPAAMPVANPLRRAPSGRERSHRTRQVSARLTCPKTKVWKTGSSQRPSAVAARMTGAARPALPRPHGLAGEVDQQREEDRVDEDGDDLERAEREPGGRYEEHGGERRVGGRKRPLRDREAVEITAGRGRLALGAVDRYIGHRQRLDLVQHPQSGQRCHEQRRCEHHARTGDALPPDRSPRPRPVGGRHPSTPPRCPERTLCGDASRTGPTVRNGFRSSGWRPGGGFSRGAGRPWHQPTTDSVINPWGHPRTRP